MGVKMLEINKIYNMNSIEGIKQITPDSIDLLFTDPPYKLVAGGRKNSLLRNKDNDNELCPFTTSGEVFKEPTPEFSDWIPLLYPIMKNSSYIFIMSNDRNLREIWSECEKAGFIFCELLVMNKSNGVPSSYFYKSCEFILMFRKGGYRKFEKYGHKTVFDVVMPRGKDKIHSTQKPVELITPILESCIEENKLVLDPFIGSASTAIACINTKRNFIGFEIDKNYYDKANKRIQDFKNKLSNVL
jgi:DNA modification methylase